MLAEAVDPLSDTTIVRAAGFFSPFARISGECSIIHSLPALFFFFRSTGGTKLQLLWEQTECDLAVDRRLQDSFQTGHAVRW